MKMLFGYFRISPMLITTCSMVKWLKDALTNLPQSYGNILLFNALTGLRPEEAIQSIKILHNKESDNYLKDNTVLEHYKYPSIFIRRTKKARGLARNCEVKLRSVGKTNECEALSPETKSLVWNSNTATKIDIGAKHGREIFTLVYSQLRLTSEQQFNLYCGIAKQKVPIQVWIATREALPNPEKRIQDALCQGIFTVHIDIVTETGEKASKDFIIKVGDKWNELDAEMVGCKCNLS
jgi:hypothetical protein